MAQDVDYSKFTPAFGEVKVEEQVATPPVEQVTEPPTETPPATSTPDQSAAPPPETLNYEFFNKTFKTDFKTEDDFKKVIELSSKAKTLEDQLKEYETLKADLEAYKTGVNPLDYFASEDDYRIQQFKKENPDKDASVAYKLFASDLGKASDLDVLIQFELLDGAVSNEAEARELISAKYDLDLSSDPKEWTALARTQLKRDANKARGEVKSMKEGYKLPDKVDIAGRREAEKADAQKRVETLTKGWQDIVPKILTDLKEVEINDYDKDGKVESLMKYVIDDEAKKQLGTEVMDYLVVNQKDINDDNVKEAAMVMQSRYVLQNLPKILKAYSTSILAEYDKKRDAELTNPNPLKTDTKPVDEAEAARKRQSTEQALGGLGFKRNKPF